ncbi:Alpha/Beta hydrolase protein [Armillaria borealis]|uniref:Alpha/Beta hydrolase protein n=1 Tax=Armillaria borealis TaxID=47425 RepID=A0AA39K549_9AGAR|nr:Alpha/Beta hydrolase protein [Armillaria borealis]
MTSPEETRTTTETYKDRYADVEYFKIPHPDAHPHYVYNGFHPGQTILEIGHVRAPGKRAFGVDVIFDRDVGIFMRDGITIYADIFRPANLDGKVPAVIPWSPYGKTGNGVQQYDVMAPYNAGIAHDRTSGYEKFEAPDPAEWCERGYAIINVDARGAGNSEGDISFWGIQEAEDIYDTIEFLTKQSWCNGSVAMAGNSWLAICQVNFASRLSHPALKAIAPWECATDPYLDLFIRGGRPHIEAFNRLLVRGMAGPNGLENVPAMVQKRPLYDEYWREKSIPVENIDVPMYILASYSSSLHTRGSFHAFRAAKTKQKWLRVHPYQEWYDLYRLEINDELQRYFDYYCKGIDNGWPGSIPPVRLSLLGFNNSPAKTVVERPEQEFPLARAQNRTFYLDGRSKSLSLSAVSHESSATHDAHSLTASSDFKFFFPKATELSGYPKIKLWVSCKEHDDLDVAVQIRKIDVKGNLLEHLNYPCPVPVEDVPNVNTAKTLGSQGFLRASHGVSLDLSKSSGNELFYAHDKREPVLPKGRIVPLEIPLWPIGMVFAENEGFMVKVSGHDMSYPETEICALKEPTDRNVGYHTIHTGGKYDSHLVLPVIDV